MSSDAPVFSLQYELVDAEEHLKNGNESPWNRWWVLCVYSIFAALQGMVWIIPGTFQDNFLNVYGMDGNAVQLVTNYGCFLFVVAAWPSMWALDRWGTRTPVLLGVGAMLVCNVLRMCARDSSLGSVALVHVSCILDALAGPVSMAAASKLAEDWFPPMERTTATAIAALSNPCGTIFVYALLPLLCPEPDAASMQRMNACILCLTAVNCAMALRYFPAFPRVAPSASSEHSRATGGAQLTSAQLLSSWGRLLRNRTYVAIVVTYGLWAGLFSPAGALLTSNLGQLDASLSLVGWVGAAANGASAILGVLSARLSDRLKARFPGSMKALLLASAAGGAVCFLFFQLAMPASGSLGLTPSAALAAACAAFIAANAFLGAFTCLAFDFAAEHSFGEPEASMLMGVLIPMNMVSGISLCVPSSDFLSWINWGVAAAAFLSLALLAALVPADSPKLQFDLEAAQTEAYLGVGSG